MDVHVPVHVQVYMYIAHAATNQKQILLVRITVHVL